MPSIALLHGWGMRPAVFDRVAAVLAARYTVYAPALPGHDGAPPVSPGDIDALAAAIAARAPARCAVAGWSLGAQIALAWARTRPQQVERLVLVSATPCFVQRDDWPAAMPVSVFDAFADAVREDAAAALRRFISLQAQGDRAAGRVARSLRAVLAAGPVPQAETLQAGLRVLRESDLRESLARIEARTLVLHGERDRLTPPDAGEYLAHALPHASFGLVQDAAHVPFVADPEGIGGRMIEFLDA